MERDRGRGREEESKSWRERAYFGGPWGLNQAGQLQCCPGPARFRSRGPCLAEVACSRPAHAQHHSSALSAAGLEVQITVLLFLLRTYPPFTSRAPQPGMVVYLSTHLPTQAVGYKTIRATRTATYLTSYPPDTEVQTRSPHHGDIWMFGFKCNNMCSLPT